ncbi:hypothetical protein C8Q76DRAFT_688360 [Earliella scabrosa]|nr:hypothetical protein C8Q76DRAFT_688360 [Earliella scabrosa]
MNSDYLPPLTSVITGGVGMPYYNARGTSVHRSLDATQVYSYYEEETTTCQCCGSAEGHLTVPSSRGSVTKSPPPVFLPSGRCRVHDGTELHIHCNGGTASHQSKIDDIEPTSNTTIDSCTIPNLAQYCTSDAENVLTSRLRPEAPEYIPRSAAMQHDTSDELLWVQETGLAAPGVLGTDRATNFEIKPTASMQSKKTVGKRRCRGHTHAPQEDPVQSPSRSSGASKKRCLCALLTQSSCYSTNVHCTNNSSGQWYVAVWRPHMWNSRPISDSTGHGATPSRPAWSVRFPDTV